VHIITISDQEFYSESEAKPEFVDKAQEEVENQGDKSP
jgi:hypothetical protein